MIQERAKGVDATFLRVYTDRFSSIRALVTRSGGSREDVEDVRQQAALNGWQHRDTLDFSRVPCKEEEAVVFSWHYVIARHVNSDRIRAERRHISFDNVFPDRITYEEYLSRKRQTEPSPHEVLEAKEKAQIVQEALATLSSEQREVLTMYYFLDMRIPEIAEKLKIPFGTVKSRMHRAKQVLRGKDCLRELLAT